MNIRIMKKMHDRLQELENQAENLQNQIIDHEALANVNVSIEKERLQSELQDTLCRIERLNAANINF